MASLRRAGSRRQQEPQPGMHRHISLGLEPLGVGPSTLLPLGLLRLVMAFAHDKPSQWHPGEPGFHPHPTKMTQ